MSYSFNVIFGALLMTAATLVLMASCTQEIDCRNSGGVYIRGMWTYQCVKAEVLK